MMEHRIVSRPCESVQCDELWSYIGMKEKTRIRNDYVREDVGDCYTWTAIDPKTKLLLAYAVGKRDNATGVEFIEKFQRATSGHYKINIKGLAINYRRITGYFIRCT